MTDPTKIDPEFRGVLEQNVGSDRRFNGYFRISAQVADRAAVYLRIAERAREHQGVKISDKPLAGKSHLHAPASFILALLEDRDIVRIEKVSGVQEGKMHTPEGRSFEDIHEALP